MKKYSFKFPFKSNFFKEQDPFHLVIVFFIIFFGTAIFFSIPTFYDYKKYNQQIENTINSEFKINMSKLEGVSFRFIPSPHLLIKKANLKIKEDENSLVSKLNNVKIFFSLIDFYNRDKFIIKRAEVSKANLYLDNLSLLNFISNLKNNIVNNFIIKKSTLFFKDQNDEVILISTIKNFNYRIDFVNNKKILKIFGNIFDSDYEFKYLIDYNNPGIQNVTIEFKRPNLYFENTLELISKSGLNIQKGVLNSQFLSQKNTINYKIIDDDISFLNKKTKNSNFDLNGSISFKPFFFNLDLTLAKINLNDIENLLYLIFKNKKSPFENLSGKVTINFDNINYKSLKKGWFQINFENSELNLDYAKFDLGEFAKLTISDYEYLENSDQILQMKVKVDINDKEKFNRFLFNFKKNKITSNNLFFIYQFNSSTGSSSISQITNKGFGSFAELNKFNNLQQLKILLKNENLFNLD